MDARLRRKSARSKPETAKAVELGGPGRSRRFSPESQFRRAHPSPCRCELSLFAGAGGGFWIAGRVSLDIERDALAHDSSVRAGFPA